MENNWGLMGHEWAVSLLRGQLARGGPRHAYLITGPKGVGRRTLGLALAKALNCIEPPEKGEFCNACRACRQINKMQYPDLSIVKRQEADRIIKVGAVRELQRMLSLAPYEATFRIALLLNFEAASESAANALLKTLEEPAEKVVLVMTAESEDALLPTIASRCEVLRLRPLQVEQVTAGLRELTGIGEKEAKTLAHICGGRPGYALQLQADSSQLAQRATWLDDQNRLLSASRKERFDYATGLGKDKIAFEETIGVWLSYWRDVMLHSGRAETPPTNVDREDEIKSVAGKIDLRAAKRMVQSLERTAGLLHTNVNARLAAEVLLLDMPNI